MSNSQLSQLVESTKNMVEHYLQTIIKSQSNYDHTIVDAMNYSLLNGGKRLRAILLVETLKCCGAKPEDGLAHAAAIEMIHAYSLVHDDLPAMDDDDLRRGKPTNHKVYGEAMAILAGDGLLNSAYEYMLQTCLVQTDLQVNYLAATYTIAEAAGFKGMIGGQAADISAAGQVANHDLLEYVHTNKTAALLRAPVVAGAQIGGVSAEKVDLFASFGYHLGMAFQIIDDILDVTGDVKSLGKATGADQAHDKLTYPKCYGLKASRDAAKSHTEKAKQALRDLDLENSILWKLCDALLIRNY